MKLNLIDSALCGWSSASTSTTQFNQSVATTVFSSLSGLSLKMKISTPRKTPGGIPKTSKIQDGIGK